MVVLALMPQRCKKQQCMAKRGFIKCYRVNTYKAEIQPGIGWRSTAGQRPEKARILIHAQGRFRVSNIKVSPNGLFQDKFPVGHKQNNSIPF